MGLWKRANSNGHGQTSSETIETKSKSNLEIEQNIPIPPRYSYDDETNPYRQVLISMKVGDSILIPHKIARKMRNQIIYLRKLYPDFRYVTRKTSHKSGEFRVWRTKSD